MDTIKDDIAGAESFGGTVQERQSLDRQATLATERDLRNNSFFKSKSLLGAGILLGTAALIAALWVCGSYNTSHDHVLSAPVGEGLLSGSQRR